MTTGVEAGLAEGKIIGINEGKAIGLNEGKAIGISEGEIKTKKEIAKKMLNLKISIEQITEITGLTREELENIVKNT